MAILPSFFGLRVEIIVNGAALPEYDYEHVAPGEAKEVTKYVEAQPGAEFAVRIIADKNFPTTNDLGYAIWTDGSMVVSRFKYKAILNNQTAIEIKEAKVKIDSEWTAQSLQLQCLQIGELAALATFIGLILVLTRLR